MCNQGPSTVLVLELAFWMAGSTRTCLLTHFQEIIDNDDLWKEKYFNTKGFF